MKLLRLNYPHDFLGANSPIDASGYLASESITMDLRQLGTGRKLIGQETVRVLFHNVIHLSEFF